MATELIKNMPREAAENLAVYKRRHGHQAIVLKQSGSDRASLLVSYAPGSAEARRIEAESGKDEAAAG